MRLLRRDFLHGRFHIGGGAFCLSDRRIVLTPVDDMSLEEVFVPVEVGLCIVGRCLGTNQIRFGLSKAGLHYVLLRLSFRQLALGRRQAGYGASES